MCVQDIACVFLEPSVLLKVKGQIHKAFALQIRSEQSRCKGKRIFKFIFSRKKKPSSMQICLIWNRVWSTKDFAFTLTDSLTGRATASQNHLFHTLNLKAKWCHEAGLWSWNRTYIISLSDETSGQELRAFRRSGPSLNCVFVGVYFLIKVQLGFVDGCSW